LERSIQLNGFECGWPDTIDRPTFFVYSNLKYKAIHIGLWHPYVNLSE